MVVTVTVGVRTSVGVDWGVAASGRLFVTPIVLLSGFVPVIPWVVVMGKVPEIGLVGVTSGVGVA